MLAFFLIQKSQAQTNFYYWGGAGSPSWTNVSNFLLLPCAPDSGGGAALDPGWGAGGTLGLIKDTVPLLTTAVGPGPLDRVTYWASNNTTLNAYGAAPNDGVLQTLGQDWTIDSLWANGDAGPRPVVNIAAGNTIYLGSPSVGRPGERLHCEWSTMVLSNDFVQNISQDQYIVGGDQNWSDVGAFHSTCDLAGTWDTAGNGLNLSVWWGAILTISGTMTNSQNNPMPFQHVGNAWVRVTGNVVGSAFGGITWYQPNGPGSFPGQPCTVSVEGNGRIAPPVGASGNAWFMHGGTLTITNNGYVSNGGGDIIMGPDTPFNYTINLYDNGTLDRGFGALFVAQNGAGATGTFNQEGGTNVGAAFIQLNDNGTYNLDGGFCDSQAFLQVNGNSVFNFNGGVIRLGNTVPNIFTSGSGAVYIKAGGAILAQSADRNYVIDAILQHGSDATTDGGFLAQNGGYVQFDADNTYNGSTVISNGTKLILNSANAIQNSTLSFSDPAGSVQFGTNGAGITAFTIGGLSGNQGIALLNADAAPITLTVGNNNQNTTYSGALSGAGASLVKAGSGSFTLTTARTANGDYTVANGTLGVQVASAGTSLTANSLTLASGSQLSFDLASLGNTIAPIITDNGNVNLNGNVPVNVINAPASGTSVLLSYTARTGSGNFVAGTVPSGALIIDNTSTKTVSLTFTTITSPHIASISPAPSTITLAGANGVAFSSYRILANTNLANSATWIPVKTNSFDGSGHFSAVIPVNPATPAAFYRLVVP